MLHEQKALSLLSLLHCCCVVAGPLPSQMRKARSWPSHSSAVLSAGRAGEQCCPLQRCCVSSDFFQFYSAARDSRKHAFSSLGD